jgi:hypothetical protein
MDRALLLNPIELKHTDIKFLNNYKYFIVGSELCQNQIPDLTIINNIHKKIKNKHIIIATPIISDSGFDIWYNFLKELNRTEFIKEIIVNDLGLLSVINKMFKISVGRILSSDLLNINKIWLKKFYIENNIHSINIDNIDLYTKVKNSGLKIYWHNKYSITANTMFCPYEKHFSINCNKSCLSNQLVLKNKDIGYRLILNEKAYFKKNRYYPPPNASLLVDTQSLLKV